MYSAFFVVVCVCVHVFSTVRYAMRFGCMFAAAGCMFGDQPDRRTIVSEIILVVLVSGGQRTEATSGTCYRFDLCTPVRFAYIITYTTLVGWDGVMDDIKTSKSFACTTYPGNNWSAVDLTGGGMCGGRVSTNTNSTFSHDNKVLP